MKVRGFFVIAVLYALLSPRTLWAQDGGTCALQAPCEFIKGEQGTTQQPCDCGEVCIKNKCYPPPYCLNDDNCYGNLKCDETKVCTCMTDADCGDAGTPCNPIKKVCDAECSSEVPCNAGYVCDVDTRTCRRPTCVSDEGCEYAFCDLKTGRCAEPGSCFNNFHCRGIDINPDTGKLDTVCIQGTCQKPPAESQPVSRACAVSASPNHVADPLGPSALVLFWVARFFRKRAIRARCQARFADERST